MPPPTHRSKPRAPTETVAPPTAGVGRARGCSGGLSWDGGGITQGDAVGCSGGLSRVGGGITQGDARGCPGGLAVASLKATWGLLSRFDCVYSGYITQGCPGSALAVAMSLRVRCFFFPTHHSSKLCISCRHLVTRFKCLYHAGESPHH